jgi:GDSL-like Lipase/Acylhydrolase family
MRPARGPGVAVTVAVAVVALLAGGCGGSSRPATLGPERPGVATRYVALGGDDNVGSRRSFADAWPQRLFRDSLPRRAVFVNVAASRSGIAEILADQVDDAIGLRPDIVTITLVDDAERATAPGDVERDLTDVLDRFRDARPKATVLVGTIPPGSGPAATVDVLDVVIRRVAAGRAVVVDLGAVDAANGDQRNAAIARAFGDALRAS